MDRINDVPFFEGERSMEYKIFPIPDLHYEIRGRAILPWKWMFIFINHQRHLQGEGNFEAIGFTWINKHKRGKQKKQNKNKEETELRFDSYNNGRKDLHRCHLSTSLISFIHETRLSSQLHKKIKIT